jgi:hypothetical protein
MSRYILLLAGGSATPGSSTSGPALAQIGFEDIAAVRLTIKGLAALGKETDHGLRPVAVLHPETGSVYSAEAIASGKESVNDFSTSDKVKLSA